MLAPVDRRAIPLYATVFLIAALTLFVASSTSPISRMRKLTGFALSLLLVMGMSVLTACGGGSHNNSGGGSGVAAPGNYNVSITASSGSITHSTVLDLEIQ